MAEKSRKKVVQGNCRARVDTGPIDAYIVARSKIALINYASPGDNSLKWRKGGVYSET